MTLLRARAYVNKHRRRTGYEAAAQYPQLRDMTYHITINGQDLHIPVPYFRLRAPQHVK